MATKSSSKQGLTGITLKPEQLIPQNLQRETRIFVGATGSTGGATQDTLYYQVPPGRILWIDNIIVVGDSFVTISGTYLTFQALSGSNILKLYAANNGANPETKINKSLKLIGGDIVKLTYTSSDLNGEFLVTISGLEEADLSAYGLATLR